MLYGIHAVAGLENFLCTLKAYHTWFYQISLTLKAGCLPFYNLLHYYNSIFLKLVLCQKVFMYLEAFLWTEQKTESFQYDLKEKKNFPDFRVLDSALYPRQKTRKSRKFCLPQIMTLIVIQNLKTPKRPIDTKTKRFHYALEQKGKFPRFVSFWFCSILKIENSIISEISLLIQILTA